MPKRAAIREPLARAWSDRRSVEEFGETADAPGAVASQFPSRLSATPAA
jgi:hypothetical protein